MTFGGHSNYAKTGNYEKTNFAPRVLKTIT
jgi:hypothetical protein